MPAAPDPASSPGRLGAVVLAGGRSRRFGSDKLEAPLGAGRLLDAALSAALERSTDVVVVGPLDRAVPAGVRVVRESPDYAGPYAAVLAGVAALEGVDRVLVLAGDLLDPGPAAAAVLTAFDLGADVEVAVAVDGEGRRQPLLAVFDRSALRRMTDGVEATDRPARALLDGLRVVDVVVPARSTTDVDTPRDLPDVHSS